MVKPGSGMMSALALTCVLATSAVARKPPPPVPPAEPVRPPAVDELRAKAKGVPVFFAISSKLGANAFAGATPIGTFPNQINEVPVAALDAERELLWIVSKGTLSVIDLRLRAPSPIVIVKNMPPIEFTVAGASSIDKFRPGTHVVLEWGAKKSKLIPGHHWMVENVPDFDKAEFKLAKKAKIANAAWLKANFSRPLKKLAHTERTLSSDPEVEVPNKAVRCEEGAGECGRAMTFGATAHKLVVTAYSCGDGCYVECHLYDPAKKLFSSPPPQTPNWGPLDQQPTGACGGYHFDASGKFYLTANAVCAAGGACSPLGDEWRTVGWLDPGLELKEL